MLVKISSFFRAYGLKMLLLSWAFAVVCLHALAFYPDVIPAEVTRQKQAEEPNSDFFSIAPRLKAKREAIKNKWLSSPSPSQDWDFKAMDAVPAARARPLPVRPQAQPQSNDEKIVPPKPPILITEPKNMPLASDAGSKEGLESSRSTEAKNKKTVDRPANKGNLTPTPFADSTGLKSDIPKFDAAYCKRLLEAIYAKRQYKKPDAIASKDNGWGRIGMAGLGEPLGAIKSSADKEKKDKLSNPTMSPESEIADLISHAIDSVSDAALKYFKKPSEIKEPQTTSQQKEMQKLINLFKSRNSAEFQSPLGMVKYRDYSFSNPDKFANRQHTHLDSEMFPSGQNKGRYAWFGAILLLAYSIYLEGGFYFYSLCLAGVLAVIVFIAYNGVDSNTKTEPD